MVFCGWLGGIEGRILNVIMFQLILNCPEVIFCVLSQTPPNDTYKNINGDLIYNYNVITITINRGTKEPYSRIYKIGFILG